MSATTVSSGEPTATGQISLTLHHLGDALRIEVGDPDPRIPVLAGADQDAECGRGLVLVEALSSEWSYFFPEGGGKVVYCIVDMEGGNGG